MSESPEDDQDVPPLEDCSAFYTSPPEHEPPMPSASERASTTRQQQAEDGGFAGMKKGFLNQQRPKKEKSSDDNIPFIKPSNTSSSLRFPEVQEAMKSPLLNSHDWVTDDLLQKIEANPKLARRFTDPRMAEALRKFHTDQAAAMNEFKNDHEVQEFIQEFCTMMGDHFTQLSSTTKSQPNAPTSLEDKKIQDLLSNSDIQAALLDKDIQTLVSLLKSEPDKAQRFLSQANTDLKQKVQLLVSAGILAVQ